jgi:acyl-CoA synthetase (AMP-forming)/AMP-acid ligase II
MFPKALLARSVSLHPTAICRGDAVGLSSTERVLAIVPMFHINAWGLPFRAALTGAELLMPRPFPQGEALARFIEAERATLLAVCRRCSPRSCSTSTPAAATSARCAAAPGAARPCRDRSWRASSATACASGTRGA